MQALESENEPFYGSARIFSLQSGKEMDLLELEALMQSTRTTKPRTADSSFGVEQKTVLVIDMRHYGDLPQGFADLLAARAFDLASARGVRMKDVVPSNCVTGVALPVREM